MMRPGKKLKMPIGLFIVAAALVSNFSVASDFKTIDTAQLHSMVVDNAYRLEAGRERQFTVIDARMEEEYDEAHVFSAISIPEKGFEKSVGLLPKDKGALLVVYCNDAKLETSKKWAGKAAAAGYTHIVIYSERFSAWVKHNMPIAPL